MRVLLSLTTLGIMTAGAWAADAPSPGVLIKCTGTEERQVRDLVADEKGRLKKGDFSPVETKAETFEQIFKANPFRVVTKDRTSVTNTETCEVEGTAFTCTTKRGLSPTPYVIVFNLETGAYAATANDELVKSRRSGTCDVTAAKKLLEQVKNNPAK